MKKKQSGRLTEQHKKNQGVIGIFGKEAQKHDKEVYSNSKITMKKLEEQYPMLTFR